MDSLSLGPAHVLAAVLVGGRGPMMVLEDDVVGIGDAAAAVDIAFSYAINSSVKAEIEIEDGVAVLPVRGTDSAVEEADGKNRTADRK